MPYAHRNRRTGRRVYLRTQIECADAGGARHDGALGNLGDGGIFIHAPAPYAVGTRLALSFKIRGEGAGRTLRALGEVVWVRRAGGARLPGFGVRFVDIDPEDARVIGCLLGRRESERRALGSV